MSDVPQDPVSQEPVAPPRQEAPTDAVAQPADPAPAPSPKPRSSSRSRSQRNRRLVWLTVAVTSLVGAAWTAISTSLVERAQNFLAVQVDIAQRGPEIRRLNEEIAARQAQYDALLASTGTGLTAYVFLPFRSRQFCVDEVKAWARDSGFKVTEPPDPTLFIIWVDYFGASLELRCVGASYANITFLIVTGSGANQRKIDAAQAALAARLASLSTYPEVASPRDQNWVATGPFVEVGYVTYELTYGEYQRWVTTGVFPPALVGTLTRPSTKLRNNQSNGWTFLTVDEPGSTLTMRSPAADSYLLQAGDGSWKPAVEVLAPGALPAESVMVRTQLLTVVAGLNYGQYGVDSPNGRYLAQDAIARLGTAPGVVNGGMLDMLMRNW